MQGYQKMTVKFATHRLAQGLIAAALLTLAGAASALEYRYIKIDGPAPTQPGGWTEAVDVNAGGLVLGNSGLGGGSIDQVGYIYDHGSYTVLTGPADAASVRARAISNDGTVVGEYRVAGTQSWNSFIYSGGQYQTFAAPDGYLARLSGISPDGRYLAGESGGAFVYDRLTGTLTRGPAAVRQTGGVNDSGVVVGYEADAVDAAGHAVSAPFTFDSLTGAFTVYGSMPSGSFSDIDNGGRILGYGKLEAGGYGENFVGRPGQFGVLDARPALIYSFLGMNDQGWLVGAYVPDLDTMSVEGFVAIPVPEPGTWALLAGGLAFVGWRARRRA